MLFSIMGSSSKKRGRGKTHGPSSLAVVGEPQEEQLPKSPPKKKPKSKPPPKSKSPQKAKEPTPVSTSAAVKVTPPKKAPPSQSPQKKKKIGPPPVKANPPPPIPSNLEVTSADDALPEASPEKSEQKKLSWDERYNELVE